ncbi:MAG: leucine-rich repeat protein, partial [Prevotella sp.]|nr:leucine-rich repeat protein [Prevotella sp.]
IPEKVIYKGIEYCVNSIGERAFSGAWDMTSVSIPNSITTIGDFAFSGCTGMTSVVIPNSVTSIGESAFAGCSGLTSVTIPNSVTSIGKSVFYGCTGLVRVTIPNSIKKIGDYAFYNCSGLTSIIIPNSVIGIGESTFSQCPGLLDVYCNAEKVPSTDASAFQDSYIEFVTLHVPELSIEAYKTTAPWSGFGEIVLLSPYKLTYLVDGEVYKTYLHEKGISIPVEEAPIKEGYSFSGWSEIPSVMPDHDVEVTGSFTINKYNLTYTVDGEEYKTEEIEYGAEITPEAALEKEGYTFSGWSEIPETMPAHDVEVTGTFTINTYTLTYMVDGEEHKTEEIEYGTEIIPEAAPEKDGYTFSGWSEIPETMPAHDVTVTGSFEKIILGKCATPTIAFKDGEFKFESEDEGVEFEWSFNIVGNSGKGSKASAPAKFVVSVYATKEYYENSEPVTMEMDMRSTIGDVSGDNKVDATDLTKLIDILLKR